DCSIPRLWGGFYSDTRGCQTLISKKVFCFNWLGIKHGRLIGYSPCRTRGVAQLDPFHSGHKNKGKVESAAFVGLPNTTGAIYSSR
ncbi:hypothetical protein, partial [Pseudomonas helleri]|uniref:hypothetical protein n=2 Tax=Pseudomonas helleri TaxID=1608996 RepID=UPI003FD3000A